GNPPPALQPPTPRRSPGLDGERRRRLRTRLRRGRPRPRLQLAPPGAVEERRAVGQPHPAGPLVRSRPRLTGAGARDGARSGAALASGEGVVRFVGTGGGETPAGISTHEGVLRRADLGAERRAAPRRATGRGS